jgi:hypothetical protein
MPCISNWIKPWGGNMKKIDQLRQELLLKEIRTAYWEMNHRIPSVADLDRLEAEVLA